MAVSLEGPIEFVEGRLILAIPLNIGGEELSLVAPKDQWKIKDDCFVFELPAWLAEKLRVGPNDFVIIDNLDGKFT